MMNKVVVGVLCGVIGGLLCVWICQKPSLPPSSSTVAFVNYSAVMSTLPASCQLRADLEAHLKECQRILMEKEEVLRKEYQDVLECLMSKPKDYEQAKAIEDKRQQFKVSLMDVQRDAEAMRIRIQQAYENALQKIKESLSNILREVAVDRGYRSIQDAKYALFYHQDVDLTDTVKMRLQEKTQKVSMNL